METETFVHKKFFHFNKWSIKMNYLETKKTNNLLVDIPVLVVTVVDVLRTDVTQSEVTTASTKPADRRPKITPRQNVVDKQR